MKKYALLTEAAMDAALTSASFSSETSLPNVGRAVHEVHVADNIVGFRVTVEPKNPFFALVGIRWIEQLAGEGVSPAEIFRRIARVVKGLASPPVHLPRQWSEYHYRNLLAFFALPREYSNVRWVADINGQLRCARFDFLSSDGTEVDLKRFAPAEWPIEFANQIEEFLSVRLKVVDVRDNASMAQEVDLQAIGSGSVVAGRTYEEWLRHLSAPQSEILTGAPSASIRIVGPAGSGKTLSLCMRALQISRRDDVIAQGQRILIATHSWAMSERIDGVLNSLNGGISPDGITVFPLLSLLELHVGHIGQRKTDVVGDDSSEGRLKSFEIIAKVLHRIDVSSHPNVSGWIKDGLSASPDSRIRLELVINLYDEISGVLTASGVAPDDQESIRDYMSGTREEWMPPFLLLADRGFVIAVYKLFIGDLVDRGAITTDQMILDSIRVLETFTWRMKRETEGYDYILVDELQLFDPQERAALELLGRTKGGVPFITAEDPSQGVFSALNSRRTNVDNVPVYLDTVHRFNKEIFEFINFVYRQFPLNALPLRIGDTNAADEERPMLVSTPSQEMAITKAVDIVEKLLSQTDQSDRICVATLGDVDSEVTRVLNARKVQVTRLGSFDDVEQLSYSRRSVVVSPWQFIGGTQFAHVVVLAVGIEQPTSQFGRLREMISVYLACSRAARSLHIICAGYVPAILTEGSEHGFLNEEAVV